MNKTIHQETVKAIKELGREYSADEVPKRFEERLQKGLEKILVAETPMAAKHISDKLLESALTSYLAAWARGDIKGKTTPESLRRDAQAAINLASFLDKKEQTKAADGQRKRAEELLREADIMEQLKLQKD